MDLDFLSVMVFLEEGETLDLEQSMKNCNRETEWIN